MHREIDSHGAMEPDLARCRTTSVGAKIPGTDTEMYYCRINNADCKYATSFAFDYFCKHPDNRLFAIPEDADPNAALQDDVQKPQRNPVRAVVTERGVERKFAR